VKCEIVEREARPVLSISSTTSVKDLPQTLGYAYMSVTKYIGRFGQQPKSEPFVAYYNMNMEALHIEAGYEVLGGLPGHDDIRPSTIPAGRYATVTYTGPYSEMAVAYEALNKWMAENGHKPTGTVYEFYMNEPIVTPEDQLVTMIMFPLA